MGAPVFYRVLRNMDEEAGDVAIHFYCAVRSSIAKISIRIWVYITIHLLTLIVAWRCKGGGGMYASSALLSGHYSPKMSHIVSTPLSDY